MIEVVRACLVADDIAHLVDFISFGTNDLTQATFSFSREDAEGKFLPFYLEKGIVSINPFQRIDTKGVGRLMKMAVEMSRDVKKDIEVGICGEHGGDPGSIEFCSNIGLDYVSASSHRIPIAILRQPNPPSSRTSVCTTILSYSLKCGRQSQSLLRWQIQMQKAR